MSKEDKLRAKALGTAEMEKRLATFRQMTYADLLGLPDNKTDNLNSGKYAVQVTTYRTDLQDDGLQIAVQWYFHIRLGYGWIGADGFMISTDDEIRDLEEKELYEFT